MSSTVSPHSSRSKDPEAPTLTTKNTFQEGHLLFINHHIINGGSQNVHRPDRSTVGSHVQKVIRKKKQLSTTLRLMPRIIAPVRFEHRLKNVKREDGDMLDGRRAVPGQDDYSPETGSTRCQSVRLVWSSSEQMEKGRLLVLDERIGCQENVTRPLSLYPDPDGGTNFVPTVLQCCKS